MSNNILTTSLILIYCFSAFLSKSSADEQPAKPRPKITISKETTFITEPLDADGYPDYVAALNQHCSRGVTPENNAAVLFWKAVGPAEIKPERREQYFKMLGMEPLPEKGEYFRKSDKQVDLHKNPQNNTDEYVLDPLYGELNKVTSQLWSQDDFPVWANWLEVNEKPMALIVEASKRPRRYDPWFSSEKYKHAISFRFTSHEYRDVARAFLARAMLRAHQGKIDEAWGDIMVIHHLARLVGQGPTFVDLLVALTIDSMANVGERAMLAQANMSAVTIASMQNDFRSLQPLSDVINCFHYGEQLFALSIIVDLSSYSCTF
ncbi:MAG: hypothetical protein GX594_12930 [Pirellulaceae bacterium]|nr:hypothetical protein [Pirellulaceae bacterium]